MAMAASIAVDAVGDLDGRRLASPAVPARAPPKQRRPPDVPTSAAACCSRQVQQDTTSDVPLRQPFGRERCQSARLRRGRSARPPPHPTPATAAPVRGSIGVSRGTRRRRAPAGPASPPRATRRRRPPPTPASPGMRTASSTAMPAEACRAAAMSSRTDSVSSSKRCAGHETLVHCDTQMSPATSSPMMRTASRVLSRRRRDRLAGGSGVPTPTASTPAHRGSSDRADCSTRWSQTVTSSGPRTLSRRMQHSTTRRGSAST